jgi:inosine-uridine nucleoside N-ribohydrolase
MYPKLCLEAHAKRWQHPEFVPVNFLDQFHDLEAGNENRSDVGNYIASRLPAYIEILNQLRSNPPGAVDIVLLGPATNAALALAADPEVFGRVNSIIMMGGALRHAGNQTPKAEFNVYGDPDGAAQIFSLSSESRKTSGTPQTPIFLVPLDITTYHILPREVFLESLQSWIERKDPLACFLQEVLLTTFEKIEKISGKTAVGCHDPLTIFALLHPDLMTWEMLDIRVETEGLWTRGETVIDTRGRKRWPAGSKGAVRDNGNWLHGETGNCISVLTSSGDDASLFGLKLLQGIFGSIVSNQT